MADLGSIPILIQRVVQTIKANGNNDITGPVMQSVLVDVIDTLKGLVDTLNVQSGALFAVNPGDETVITDNSTEGVATVRVDLEHLATLFADIGHSHEMSEIIGLLSALGVINNTLDEHLTLIGNKEDSLGNPTTDGDMVVSTAAGVRSWETPLRVEDIEFPPGDAFDFVRELGVGRSRLFRDHSEIGGVDFNALDIVFPAGPNITYDDEPGVVYERAIEFEWNLFVQGGQSVQFRIPTFASLTVYGATINIGNARFDDLFYASHKEETINNSGSFRPIDTPAFIGTHVKIKWLAWGTTGGTTRVEQVVEGQDDKVMAHSFGKYQEIYTKRTT